MNGGEIVDREKEREGELVLRLAKMDLRRSGRRRGGVGAAAENDRYCDILCTEVDIGGTLQTHWTSVTQSQMPLVNSKSRAFVPTLDQYDHLL